MTPREAGELVVRMQARWPGFCRDAVAITEWTNDLVPLRAEWAQMAYRRCVDSLDRPPSWAAFFETYRAQVVAHPVKRPAIEGPPEKEADPEKVHALVGALHSKLRAKAPR